MTEKNKKIIERYAPSILSLFAIFLFLCLYYIINFRILYAKFQILLNISMALAAIYLGFSGNVIGAVISIFDSKLMKQLYRYKADRDFISYIKSSAYSSILLFFLAVALFFVSEENFASYFIIVCSIWWIVFVFAFVSSARVIYYLFIMLLSLNEYNRKLYKISEGKVSIDPANISKHPIKKDL